MPITDQKLLAFTKKVADFPDKPSDTMTAAEIKAQFDAAPDELRGKHNNLIDALVSTTAGDSGAKNIGTTSITGLTGSDVQTILESTKSLIDTKANSSDVYTKTALDTGQLDNRYFTEAEIQSTTDGASGAHKVGSAAIPNVTGTTVYGQISNLKTQIDNVTLGQIPDGSLTNVKLNSDIKVGSLAALTTTNKASVTDAVNELKTNVDTHLAETTLKANKTINVPADYATIQAALDSLKYTWIPSDVTVTISVAAGTHSYTSPVNITHPCGSQIQIIGATPISTTISSAGTISGTAGAWSVPITVSSAASIEVGQYAIVRNTSGTDDHFAHRGIWEITAVDTTNNIVTVKNTHRSVKTTNEAVGTGDGTATTFYVANTPVVPDSQTVYVAGVAKTEGTDYTFDDATGKIVFATAPASGDSITATYKHFPKATLSGGDFVVLTTILKFSGDGIVLTDKSLGLIDNVAIVGSGSGYGVKAGEVGASTIKGASIVVGSSVGVNGFSYGFISANGSSIYASSSTASGNSSHGFFAQFSGSIYTYSSTASGNGSYGFFAISSSIYAYSSTASGNGSYGFYAQHSGSIYANSCTASGNGSVGYYALLSSSIYAYSSTASGNSGYGFFAQFSGSIYAYSSTASGNGTDYKADRMGYIYCNSYAGSPTFSPAVNTEGNYNSIITT